MRKLFSYLASGDSDRRASCQTRTTHFWRQIKSLKTSNVQIFPFVNLSMSLPNYKSLCLFWVAFFCEKRCPTSMAFWHQADWHTNLPPFQGARPDHVRVESSNSCFPKELWSFVRPGASWIFDPWHALLQSENVFELGGITKLHLDRSGSQSQRWIWFILPARGAGHIRRWKL